MNSISKQLVSGLARLAPARAAQGERHSNWTIALHWASVAAILVTTAAGLSRELIEEDRWREIALDIHRQTGLFVLFALGLRLLVRLTLGMRDFAHGLPAPLRWAARLAHLALYALLLTLPMLGLAVSNAHAVPVRAFGLFVMPNLAPEDPDLADVLTDYHVWAAWSLLVIVVAHVGAALWHHYHRRDGVLAAMLPLAKRRS